MTNRLLIILLLSLASLTARGQTANLSIVGSDFARTAVFNNVTEFEITIVVNGELAAGLFNNPDLTTVNYSVSGTLPTATPSGFDAFNLERMIDGAEFYAQGSSLQYEIAADADLSDGVQVDELVGTDVVLTFNGREVDNGRFHPALLEMRADGTGRIQNSDNVVTASPLQAVDFGEEYITDFTFDPAATTVLVNNPPPPPDSQEPPPVAGFGANGSIGVFGLGLLSLLVLARGRARLTL
ncbi:MAG: hypothetical protein AAGJ86_01615 [Pseudomonadota bacterium]